MPFKFVKAKNASSPAKEYVVLKATGDRNNLQGYAVVDKTFRPDGSQSNTFRHIFIFPNKEVNKGEYVVLWSGRGQAMQNVQSGSVYHHFFWNSDTCVWNNSGDQASLIRYDRQDEIRLASIIS